MYVIESILKKYYEIGENMTITAFLVKRNICTYKRNDSENLLDQNTLILCDVRLF